ncbi:hypothetical protein PR048_006375 [Dryococelus australis]|uniref:Uncharacterized protein n=1 Tax=Dryococelus australis TaxID=614101 RepID=A0ABQ9IAS9_9NEOP|nr:hypothetical protein PR048_006375 [Dryococelus australis]
MGRKLKTIFDRWHPITLSTSRVETTDTDDKQRRHFTEVDRRLLHNFGSGPKWIPGVVIAKNRPVMYNVQTTETRQIHQHHVD